jgi:hypothetical protein
MEDLTHCSADIVFDHCLGCVHAFKVKSISYDHHHECNPRDHNLVFAEYFFTNYKAKK